MHFLVLVAFAIAVLLSGCASNPERISMVASAKPVAPTFKLHDQRPVEDRETRSSTTGGWSEKVLGDDAITPSPFHLIEAELARHGNEWLAHRTLTITTLQVLSRLQTPSVDARETYSAAGVGPAGPALAAALIYGFRVAKTRPTILVRTTIAEDNREYSVYARGEVGFSGNSSEALNAAITDAAKQLIERMRDGVANGTLK
jgi:hypothetical protein